MPERLTPRPEVAAAFAAAAGELQLEMAPAAVEARCVGVAFAAFHRTVDAELDDSPGSAPPGSAPTDAAGAAARGEADEATASPSLAAAEPAAAEPAATTAVIRAHLQAWEELSPEQFGARWRDYATDPYVGVGPGWVGTVDEATVERWLGSAELREATETHPPFSPRQVALSNLQVFWLGPARVVVTYRAEETYRNSKVAAGNTFAVLLRVKGVGWRIAVASKGTRHEAPLRA